MMRILTILLLPLLFIATSCDSGGAGTACSIDASGKWVFEEFNILDLSPGCECLDEEGAIIDCAQVGLKETLENALECMSVYFGGHLVMNFCDSDSDNNGLCDCSEENNCFR